LLLLGLGEASSIAVAKSRGFVFASDDKAARREATLMEVKLTGTLGILKNAAKHKIIDLKECHFILSKMTAKEFYSAVKSLKEL
jgi:predicted nucleic acid-binding protein